MKCLKGLELAARCAWTRCWTQARTSRRRERRRRETTWQWRRRRRDRKSSACLAVTRSIEDVWVHGWRCTRTVLLAGEFSFRRVGSLLDASPPFSLLERVADFFLSLLFPDSTSIPSPPLFDPTEPLQPSLPEPRLPLLLTQLSTVLPLPPPRPTTTEPTLTPDLPLGLPLPNHLIHLRLQLPTRLPTPPPTLLPPTNVPTPLHSPA